MVELEEITMLFLVRFPNENIGHCAYICWLIAFVVAQYSRLVVKDDSLAHSLCKDENLVLERFPFNSNAVIFELSRVSCEGDMGLTNQATCR